MIGRCLAGTVSGLLALGMPAFATPLATPVPLIAQVPTPDRPEGQTDVEAGALSSLSLGLRLGGVSAAKEIFYEVGRGVSVGFVAGATFENDLVVEAVLEHGRHGDGLGDRSASTIDVAAVVSRRWAVGRWRVAAGPVVGYAWVSREIQLEWAGGAVAGGQVGVDRRTDGPVDFGLVASLTWSLYRSPELRDDPSSDPDGRAFGRRLRLGVRLVHRWPRGGEAGGGP